MEVNFWGSVQPVLAALPHMVAQDYGRIVMTTSAAGLFGQREHVAYAAAKLAVVGFARALALDTARRNIRVNLLSPYARTRTSAHVLPEAMENVMPAGKVAPVAGWLASEACDVTGQIYAAGAGRLRRNAFMEGPIIAFDSDEVGSAFPAAAAFSTITEPRNSGHSALDLIPELKQRELS